MDVKQKIESILEDLKKAGISRSKAEEDLGYSPNYITQSLSRDGEPNLRILRALELYFQNLSYKSQIQTSVVNADAIEYEVRKKWEIKTEALINEVLEKSDQELKESKEEVKKLKEENQKLLIENAKLLDIISNLTKEKSGNVNTTSLKENAPAAKRNSQKKNKGL
ncbi:hypothetical protein A4D02_18910 [Niastella koreensis]|uniref:Uncharacterized protein n=2 Tax=Niastella koreensis TaxID=354356 RepID=G8T7X2_NIAKG|nr:hypothetical protein [Niastella koreensis]AEV96910.1 hypothetical protein Niako_0515 [Niastella koreensis GR20-10]OQP39387.1 hypothetical protein A4D02_18910 [Niastella koreensis]